MIGVIWTVVRNIDYRVWLGLLIALMVYGVYLKGVDNGYDKAIEETNREKLETIHESLRIKEKTYSIPRPGDGDVINRLREKTF